MGPGKGCAVKPVPQKATGLDPAGEPGARVRSPTKGRRTWGIYLSTVCHWGGLFSGAIHSLALPVRCVVGKMGFSAQRKPAGTGTRAGAGGRPLCTAVGRGTERGWARPRCMTRLHGPKQNPSPGTAGGHASSWIVLGCRRDPARGDSAPRTRTIPHPQGTRHWPGPDSAMDGAGFCPVNAHAAAQSGVQTPGGRQDHFRWSQTHFYFLTLFVIYLSSWVFKTKVTFQPLLSWVLSLSYDIAECNTKLIPTSRDRCTDTPMCTHTVE